MLRCLVYADPMSLVEFSNPESSSIIREISRVFNGRVIIELANSQSVRDNTAFAGRPDIFVLPGIFGQTSLYPEHIGEYGNANIRRFIEEGGSFFGVCAGAYYAASHIVYEPKWGARKERNSGTLALFNGVARGPINGVGRNTHDRPATLHDEISHVDPVSITITDGPMDGVSFEVAYGLGPAFYPATEDISRTRVIARYSHIEGNPPAIIDVAIGRGHALLSGVLPQFGQEDNPAHYRSTLTPPLSRLLHSLYRHRKTRHQFWGQLMQCIDSHQQALKL